MIKRLLFATAGALVVTAALLLMMNRAANHLAVQDPVQYFGVSDFHPYTGRRRPPPRPTAQERPESPEFDTEAAPATEIPLTRPELPPLEPGALDIPANAVPDRPAADSGSRRGD